MNTNTYAHTYISAQGLTVIVIGDGGARGIIVIVVGNEHGDSSSNPGRD